MRPSVGIAIGSLVLASLSFGACTRTWALSGDPDAGAPLDAITSDAGGAGGKGGKPAATGGQGQGGAQGVGGTAAAAGTTGAAGIAGAGGAGGRPPPGCSAAQDQIMVQIQTTDLIFVVARTMSMGTKIGDTTRINAVQSALRYLIQNNQSAVNFGYAEFPATGQGPCPNACCTSSNTVPTQARNWDAIDNAMHRCDFGQSCLAQNDGRPIAATLVEVPKLWGQPHNPTVVLIVDGPPGCQFEDPSQTCQPALDAVSMLKGMFEFDLVVVALGQDAQNNMCLKNMVARAGNPTGLIPIPEGSPDPVGALITSISPIVAEAAKTSCTLKLNSKPPRMDLVSVWIGTTEVPFDSSGTNGWKFVAESSVGIQVSTGSWCQKLRNARQADVTAKFNCAPCGEVSPCPRE